MAQPRCLWGGGLPDDGDGVVEYGGDVRAVHVDVEERGQGV